MSTLRAIKFFLAIGWFVMTAMLFIACSARVVPAVVSNQTKSIAMGTTFLTTKSAASIFTVAWSPNGKLLALGYADGSVQVRDAATGKIDFNVLGHSSHVWALAWSPDGKRLASASWDHTVQVWDASTGMSLLTYRGHSDLVLAVAWSPDGKRIASSGSDDTVQVWDATSGQHMFTYHGHSGTVTSVTWSPDGRFIASGSYDKTVQVWNASTGDVLYTFSGYNIKAAKLNPAKGVLPDLILDVAWSPNGKRIASGGADATAQVWDAMTGRRLAIDRRDTAPVWDVAWSPDGNHLACACWDGTVVVWQPSGAT